VNPGVPRSGSGGVRPVGVWAIASLLTGAALLVLGAALMATPRTGVALALPRQSTDVAAARAPAPGASTRDDAAAVDPIAPSRGSTRPFPAAAPLSELVPPRPVTTDDAATPAVELVADEPLERPGAVSRPLEVEVPAIGVRAAVIELGLDARGRLEVPSDPEVAGWWTGGPEPGAPGPAVIAGHVDSVRGPGVFFRLADLARGDRIVVRGEDGTVARFAVDRIERWPKDGFPTDAVYRQADGAELRLITCGGTFDREALRYLDNVIVFARAVDDG
jgi:hypothetical protein